MTTLLKNKKPRREKDNYPTPWHIAQWVVRKCFDLAPSQERYFFLEPGCGDTAPFMTAASMLKKSIVIQGVDIRQVYPFIGGASFIHEDYFKYSDGSTNKWDIIATNPPFDQALGFWHKSMELLTPQGVLGLIVKLSFLATQKRAKVWQRNPPAEVHVFYPRPSFTGDGSTDIAQEYCAAFWYRPEFARLICRSPLTTLQWVNLKALEGAGNNG